jgi:hypothetical protein
VALFVVFLNDLVADAALGASAVALYGVGHHLRGTDDLLAVGTLHVLVFLSFFAPVHLAHRVLHRILLHGSFPLNLLWVYLLDFANLANAAPLLLSH